ncbi:MAG: hypothetical protein H7833_18240 [Magnetococcus sp. DMHC-1]|nr:hypothetical protein [Magnetococcales bacterium]
MAAKTYDCFTFFDELDLLEIRLHHLWEYVDFFVLVEGDHTFRGQPKPFVYAENRSRFAWAEAKIIHVRKQFDIRGLNFARATRFTQNDDNWRMEHNQRNAILDGLGSAAPEDIILISDVDEIPSHFVMRLIHRLLGEFPRLAFQQQLHRYFLDYKMVADANNQECINSTVVTQRQYLLTPEEERAQRYKLPFLKDGGQHFSYLGGLNKIVQKLESFSHSEYDTDYFKDKTRIRQRILAGKALHSDQEQFVRYAVESDPHYPPFIIKNRDRYYHLFYSEENIA